VYPKLALLSTKSSELLQTVYMKIYRVLVDVDVACFHILAELIDLFWPAAGCTHVQRQTVSRLQLLPKVLDGCPQEIKPPLGKPCEFSRFEHVATNRARGSSCCSRQPRVILHTKISTPKPDHCSLRGSWELRLR